jgi:hypothetical protein
MQSKNAPMQSFFMSLHSFSVSRQTQMLPRQKQSTPLQGIWSSLHSFSEALQAIL